MAAAVLQFKGAAYSVLSDGSTVSFDTNVTAGNAIVVCLTHNYLGFPPSITDSQGNTYTSKGSQPRTIVGAGYLWIFTAVAGSSGALTLTLHQAGGSVYSYGQFEVSGLQSDPYDVQNVHDSGSSPATAGSITTSANGELVIAWFHRGAVGANPWTAGTGFTLHTLSSEATYAFESTVQTTAGVINPDIQGSASGSYPLFGFTASFKASAPSTQPIGPSLFRGRNFALFDDDQVNRFEFWPAAAASADVNVALTGVSATAGVGSFSVSRAADLTGTAATASVGILAPSRSISISGNAATMSVGSLTPSRTAGLLGLGASSSVGTLASSRTVSISGNPATSAVGTLTPVVGVTVALTGVSANASVGNLGVSHTNSLTGISATTSVGTVTPSIGVNVALTGVQVTTSIGILSPATSKPLTGSSVIGSVGFLSADRSLSLSGVIGTSAVGMLSPSLTISITGVGAISAVGVLSVLSDDALAVSKNVGTGILFTAHVGVGVLRTGDARAATLITTNVDLGEIVYQDVRTDA